MGNPRLRPPAPERPVAPLLPSAAEQRSERLAHGHIIIVCGGRDYPDRDRVFAALDRAHQKRPITLLVHGACMDEHTGELLGADRWADEWARERGVKVEPHPANWELWGKAAGPMRNKQMAERGAHGLVALPGGKGTASMCGHAARFGIPIWRPYG